MRRSINYEGGVQISGSGFHSRQANLKQKLRVGAGHRVRPPNALSTYIPGRHGSLPLQDLTPIKNSGVGLAALNLNQCVLTYAMELLQNYTASSCCIHPMQRAELHIETR